MGTIVDPGLKVKLKNAMAEASSAMSRIEGEREIIKDIINEISDTQGIDKKVLRRIFKVYHKQNFQDEKDLADEVENIYESVVG